LFPHIFVSSFCFLLPLRRQPRATHRAIVSWCHGAIVTSYPMSTGLLEVHTPRDGPGCQIAHIPTTNLIYLCILTGRSSFHSRSR
jgi:hypothetical protein